MADPCFLWQWLLSALDRQEPAALLIVVDCIGSSPAKIGAKMVVSQQACVGTIGGGAVEAGLVKSARAVLTNGEYQPRLVKRAHHHSEQTELSGMICGGEQTVLLYPCRKKDQILFEELLIRCRDRTPVTIRVSAQGLTILQHHDSVSTPAFHDGEHWYYQECVGLYKHAYIIGAGHISLALSQILSMLDFDITVIDERENLNSMHSNTYATQKWSTRYTEIDKHLTEGPNIFVFIMTHSHHCDELVLAKLAGKQFAYLGLLGSRHKIASIKQDLARKHPNIALQDLHAPIGLAINSHTPEEIAVSIAAEVIKLLNTKTKD